LNYVTKQMVNYEANRERALREWLEFRYEQIMEENTEHMRAEGKLFRNTKV